MALSARDRTLVARWLRVVAISAAGGAAYGTAVSDISLPFDFVVGVLNGAMMGGLCGGFELLYVGRPIGEPCRRLPLPVHLALRSLFYVVVIVGTLYLWAVFLYPGATRWQLGDRDFTAAIIISSLVALSFNLAMSMQRMVGSDVMTSYLTGRYYRPREEERVFLFLDLVDSTAIAERIGHIAFHRLLNRFCYDISEPIALHRGEIYKYVGDEVIVTWPITKGVTDARCVRCVFDIAATIEDMRDA